MNGTSAFLRVKREFVYSLWHVRLQLEVSSLQPGGGPSNQNLTTLAPLSQSSAPRTVRNQFLWFIIQPVYDTLLYIAARTDDL